MINFDDVLKLVDMLSEDERRALLRYLQQEPPALDEQKGERVLNLHPGAAIMSDDFNEALPDDFWLDEQ
jgi:hypothetical protein